MNNLQVIENEGQRVLTTAQLADAYETTERRISENFNANKKRYVEGKHYYCLAGEALKVFKNNDYGNSVFAANLNKLYLWTEKGALLHAKSLNTDKAWEVYDELVEIYFRAQRMQTVLTDLSPQLQVLINMETRQKQLEAKQAEQDAALADMNQRLTNTCEVISLDKNSWRQDTKHLISEIVATTGSGYDTVCDVYKEVYKLVESRAGVSLKTRQTNKRRRMAEEGICKSKRDKVSLVDIIADDKKLIEIFIAIVKEMAVKYGVCK